MTHTSSVFVRNRALDSVRIMRNSSEEKGLRGLRHTKFYSSAAVENSLCFVVGARECFESCWKWEEAFFPPALLCFLVLAITVPFLVLRVI